MSKTQYQVIVVGAGSAGYSAAAALSQHGIRSALIEKADELGGLCILRGCMPSKALIESANLMRRMRNSAQFGIHTLGLRASMEEIQDRKSKLIEGFQSYREQQLREGKFDLIRGTASFVSAKEIKVVSGSEEKTIVFAHAVIATGSFATIPDIEGLKDGDFWLSRDSLDTRELPNHLIIIGGGAVGCEMAHCFEGLGSKVTIVKRTGGLLTEFDHDISELITSISCQRGITVHRDTNTKAVRYLENGNVVVKIETSGKTSELEGTHLLIATGRTPATDALNLAAAGVETKNKRIITNAHSQTTAEHIFSIGDSSAELPVVHEAVLEGENVAKFIANRIASPNTPIPPATKTELKLFGVFTHPECAHAGIDPEKTRDLGADTVSAKYLFADQGKAQILGETDGFVKIIARKSDGRILSASVIGPHAVDLIHELQVAIHSELSVFDLLAIPHYHPTLAEIWTNPAQELAEKCAKS